MSVSKYHKKSLFEQASKHTYCNFDEVIQSQYAGCFSCLQYFPTNIIDKEKHCIASIPHGTLEPTIFCPSCGVDTVIGDASGYDVKNTQFLKYMYNVNNNILK